MVRIEINSDDSLREVLLKMSEENPSAMRVMLKIIERLGNSGFSFLLQLDDMNIRGMQIFVGYKYHCGGDLDQFIKCVQEGDPRMVETINKEGRKGRYPHRAVTRGAFAGTREFL